MPTYGEGYAPMRPSVALEAVAVVGVGYTDDAVSMLLESRAVEAVVVGRSESYRLAMVLLLP